MLFIALAYTTLDRLCAVFLYNPTLAVHHMWFYASRHVWLYINTHLSVYSDISLWWLYIKHMVIYTLTFHCIACGYTSRYAVILVISRIYTSYTRMSSFHTYSNIVLYVSFSKYVSTLFLYVHTVDYQTTSVQIVHRLPNDVEISWFFLWFIVLSLNLNTLYVVMTSSKPRRYLSHVVHFLTVPTASHRAYCYAVLRYHISKLSPVPCSLYPPINGQSPYCRPTNENTDI